MPADLSLPTHRPDVRVSVRVHYIAQYSSAARQLFMYVIRIENRSPDSWQLLSRLWRITDGLGRETVVEGDGVIGQQPIIAPAGVYVCDSLVTLEAAPGRMEGHYILQDAWGNLGRADIPAFVLVAPTEDTQGRILN